MVSELSRPHTGWTRIRQDGWSRWDVPWLIVLPENLAGEDWARRLTSRSGPASTVITVGAGDADSAGLARRLDRLPLERLSGVLSMAGLGQSDSSLNAALADALSNVNARIPVWCATAGAVAAVSGDAVMSPSHTQIWEEAAAPDWDGLIDLPDPITELAVDLLLTVLADAPGDNRIAIRGTDVFARRNAAPAEGQWLASLTDLPSPVGVGATGTVQRSDPWLVGRRSFPGSAFVELALRGGTESGCEVLHELVVSKPLVLPDNGAVQVRVKVDGAPADSRRTFRIEARCADRPAQLWTRHASGVLTTRMTPAITAATGLWPPSGAVRIEPGRRRGRRGLRAAWCAGETLYVEVALPDRLAVGASMFGLHPALMDTALRAVSLLWPEDSLDWCQGMSAWHGVSLYAQGSSALRVGISRIGRDTVSLAMFDTAGALVAVVDSVGPRPRALIVPRWLPLLTDDDDGRPAVSVTDDSAAVPGHADVVAVDMPSARDDLVVRTQNLIQRWLADSGHADSRLMLLTHDAVAVRTYDPTDPCSAAVWGLVRWAQLIRPGRFVLADLGAGPVSADMVRQAAGSRETQVAVRDGTVFVPRLVEATMPMRGDLVTWPSDGTVLITSGTTAAGAAVARHLVAKHGITRLVLVSEDNSDTGIDVAAELMAHGADVTVAECDLTSRGAVAALLNQIEHPLRAVVCTAKVPDDDRPLADRVREWVNAVTHLDQLTRGHDIAAFVVVTSIAGIVGVAGDSAVACADMAAEALMQQRHRRGLPGMSVAWWPRDRSPTVPMGEWQLASLDSALGLGEPVVVVAPEDPPGARKPALQAFQRSAQPAVLESGGERPALVVLGPADAAAECPGLERFAAGFRGSRQVSALMPVACTAPDGNLPATLDALVAAQADVIGCHMGHAPFVLVGVASGGVLAIETARHLVALNRAVRAVVLMEDDDVPAPLAEIDQSRLFAAAWTAHLLAEWQPQPVGLPVLVVQGAQPRRWQLPDVSYAAVPGDMSCKAAAVEAWLNGLE